MPHRRRVHKGSFGSHFDELVARFPADEMPPPPRKAADSRSAKLQEKIDIHAWLFRQAWQVEDER
ncbi:hypothetical protein [Sphingomonas segetis]|uniref:hypothetical protein n=1 Tax=Sphingomonas segetis TaxID=1104779 RepID=UPI0012D2CBEC|nr:hypothetical protein [Sphingomonas segetis]